MGFELHYKLGGEDCRFALPEGEAFVGRKEFCDLCLVEAGVSKKHARFVNDGAKVEVHDAGSRNGTFVNGEPVEGHVEIFSGDVVQVGTIFLTLAESVAASKSYQSFEVFDDEFHGAGKGAGGSKSRVDIIEGEEELVEAGKPDALIRVFDGTTPRVHECYKDKLVSVGSKEGNAIIIGGEGVSRYHAEIYHDGSDWVAKDLGSRNGVLILQKGAKEPVKIEIRVLKPGDELQIGTVRLRFEELKPELDFGAVLRNPIFKPVAAGVLVLFVVVLAFGQLGGPRSRGVRQGPNYSTSLRQGVKFIKEGKHKEAEKLYGRLEERFKDQKAPKLFVEVAREWPDQRNPLVFDWAKAYDLLSKLQKESDRLPKYVRIWVDSEAERVSLNKDAFQRVRDGQSAYERGDRAARQNRTEAAIRAYDEAYTLLGSVSPKSEFYSRSKGQAERLGRTLYRLYVAEAKRHFGSGNSEWREATKKYVIAQSYTTDRTNLLMIRRMINECRRNFEDEQKHQRAVNIVQARKWQKYKDALALLLSVSSKSSIYPDSKAYAEWIRADVKVRGARKVYDKGDGERAIRMMREVLKVDVLGPDARNGVRKRLQVWNRVIAAYNQGRLAYAGGRDGYARAKGLLKIVVRTERGRDNYYRHRAQQMLKTIKIATQTSDLNLARAGVKALKGEKLADAILYFDRVRRSKTAPKKMIRKIAEIVTRVARERRWFKKAYWEILLRRDLSRYTWARDVFLLLRDYLPRGHKSKKEAAKRFKQIEKEIQMLGRRAG